MRVALINAHDAQNPSSRDFAAGLGERRTAATLIPPQDLAMFGTVLQAAGHDVRLIDQQIECLEVRDLLSALAAFAPTHVVTTVSQVSMQYDLQVAETLVKTGYTVFLKSALQAKNLLTDLLRDSGASACIQGECDLTIGELLTGVSNAGTARLVDGELVIEREQVLADLDRLPIINRRLLPDHPYCYPSVGSPVALLQTSRGCPYSCSYYCPYPLNQGAKWRSMSPQRIINEIVAIVDVGISKIWMRDAVFTLNRQRVVDICDGIMARDLKISWWCETRVDRLDGDLIKRMADAGCVGINVGVESGNQYIVDEVAKRGLDLANLRELRRAIRSAGMKVRFLLLLGLPGENNRTLFDTFNLVHEVEPDFVGIQIARAYEGTRFYNEAIEHGWTEERSLESMDGSGLDVYVDGVSRATIQTVRERIMQMQQLIREGHAPDAAVRQELREQVESYLLSAGCTSA